MTIILIVQLELCKLLRDVLKGLQMSSNLEEQVYTLKGFRQHLSQIAGDVQHGKQQVKVTTYGKTVGYFVPENYLAYVEALEDEIDRQTLVKIREKKSGSMGISLAELKHELGL
jgi:hypothetical protein